MEEMTSCLLVVSLAQGRLTSCRAHHRTEASSAIHWTCCSIQFRTTRQAALPFAQMEWMALMLRERWRHRITSGRQLAHHDYDLLQAEEPLWGRRMSQTPKTALNALLILLALITWMKNMCILYLSPTMKYIWEIPVWLIIFIRFAWDWALQGPTDKDHPWRCTAHLHPCVHWSGGEESWGWSGGAVLWPQMQKDWLYIYQQWIIMFMLNFHY